MGELPEGNPYMVREPAVPPADWTSAAGGGPRRALPLTASRPAATASLLIVSTSRREAIHRELSLDGWLLRRSFKGSDYDVPELVRRKRGTVTAILPVT